MAIAGIKHVGDNEYYTHKTVVAYFGEFDYDPATTKEKAEDFGIDNYDTIETDGLSQDWTQYKSIWINPPFTLKAEFIKKAWETYLLSKADIYILFPIGFLTTKRFSDTGCKGKIYIPNGRLGFESGLGKNGKSPAFGSIVMKLQDVNEVEFIIKNELL